MAEPDRKPLSTLGRGSDWVNLWRRRDGWWTVFVGRIAADGAVEYQSGAERSIHNTVTHWSPLTPAPEPTNDAVSDERLRELLPCPLFSEDMPHEIRMDETVSGRALRYVITCSCGLVFNGPYADAGSEVAPGNAKKWTIAAWNRRSVTSQASEGAVAYRIAEEGKAWDLCEEYRIPLQKFVDHYPSGINPSLDEAWRSARSVLASPSKRVETSGLLREAAAALSSIPEQGVTWKPITDHTPPDNQYWQMAVDVIERAGKGFHHAVLTNHHAATLLYWANLARDAALAPSQPAAVGVTDEMVDRAARALSVWKIKPGMAGYRMAARDMLEAALRSTP